MTISHFLQWQPNVFLYRTLGWRFAGQYLFFLGSLFFALKGDASEKISRAAEDAFGDGKTPSELRGLKKRIIRGILSHYFEKIFNAYESLPVLTSFLRDHISVSPLRKLDEALKRNKGVLFVTAHYGGVEYIPIFLAMHHYPISVVFKCSTSQLQDALHRRAEELKIKVIDPGKGNTAAAVLNDLRENRIVFIECDEIEAWSPSQKEKMVFLGKEIGVDRTLNILKRRSGAEIVFGIVQRFDMNSYALILEAYEDILFHLGKVPASPAAALLKRLEHYIYAYPDEWYQWKLYASLDAPAGKTRAVKARKLAPVLEPSFRPA
jgi:KDO2-lipid IV(A) lauroyltransferase